MPARPFTLLDGRFPIAPHEHVAVLYRGRRQAFGLASFLAEGLGRGDRCMYLAPASFHADMLRTLGALEPRLDGFLGSGNLRVESGASDFGVIQALTERVFIEAERARTPGVRWLEEGSWADARAFPMPQFFQFHALLNFQVKHYPSVALCQYDLEKIETHELFCSIAVHRHLLVEETLVRDNPFYIPAEKFIPLSPQERERDLVGVFREVGFDVGKLLEELAGYGRLHRSSSSDS